MTVMNTRLSLKVMALDAAKDIDGPKSTVFETAQSVYEWLLEEVEEDENETSVTKLDLVN